MIKLHVEFDIQAMEDEGYSYENFFNLLPDWLQQVGLGIEESDNNGYVLIKGPDKNTDLAYIGLVAKAFIEIDWIKKSLKKLLLLTNRGTKDGSFYVEGDFIKSWKKYNLW